MRTPTMLTTDLSLRFDPAYEKISRRFHEHPDELADAFARAWFKLTHRDMGPSRGTSAPRSRARRCSGRTRSPRRRTSSSTPRTSRASRLRSSTPGLSVAQLVSTAWASASTFRGSDKRGGANGARIRLEPQNRWEVNDPDELATVLHTLEGIQDAFNSSQAGGKPISLADLIVLGGAAAIEQAAQNAGHDVEVPFTPGPHRRVSGADRRRVLRRARADCGWVPQLPRQRHRLPAEYLLIDRANLLTLSAPEMAVLVGGLRVLGANSGQSQHGVFTSKPGSLTNDFFVNLLDMGTRGRRGPTDASSRAVTAPPESSSGPAAASTSCSARTPNCARLRRSMRATTRGRSSCTTSSRPGSK